ncbi:hypothetical protein GCM10018773_39540 [Streptomyces candidus]|nr:hypothetical protein GCM10018773_39540 [Streptomyces candidus]
MKAAVITMASANQRRRSAGALPDGAGPAAEAGVGVTAEAATAGIGDPAGVSDGGAGVMPTTLVPI